MSTAKVKAKVKRIRKNFKSEEHLDGADEDVYEKRTPENSAAQLWYAVVDRALMDSCFTGPDVRDLWQTATVRAAYRRCNRAPHFETFLTKVFRREEDRDMDRMRALRWARDMDDRVGSLWWICAELDMPYAYIRSVILQKNAEGQRLYRLWLEEVARFEQEIKSLRAYA